MSLQRKIVLVTGGTGALGQVVLRRFLTEGANFATSYRSEEGLNRLPTDLASKVYPVRADVTDEQELAKLFDLVGDKYGGVDVLVNTVGGFLPGRSVSETSLNDWEQMMEVNLNSTFLCSRMYLKLSKGKSYGRIISIAAMLALRPRANRAAYAVSKAGVTVLIQVMGEELKGSGITANAIAPSVIRTFGNTDSAAEEDTGKWVGADEIAELVVFLCSESGKSINGATIPVFGGI